MTQYVILRGPGLSLLRGIGVYRDEVCISYLYVNSLELGFPGRHLKEHLG